MLAGPLAMGRITRLGFTRPWAECPACHLVQEERRPLPGNV